jgi:hypothetical protein
LKLLELKDVEKFVEKFLEWKGVTPKKKAEKTKKT